MPLPRAWRRRAFAAVLVAAFSAAVAAAAQDAPQPAAPAQAGAQRGQGMRGQFAGMQRANGEITAVNGSTFTIKDETGAVSQVTVTDNTRIMKGRGETVKAADLKVGDGLIAMGNLDAPNKTLHAAMVMATDAATLKAMKDNLGKTYITGRVTAIDVDNAKMTIERPDHITQTIGFDENTSFRRGRGVMLSVLGAGNGNSMPAPSPDSAESITLADIKVGDNITGQGSLKSGVFIPTQLSVAPSGQRRNGAGRTPPSNPTNPPATPQ